MATLKRNNKNTKCVIDNRAIASDTLTAVLKK